MTDTQELLKRLEGGERTWLRILRQDKGRILPPETESRLLAEGLVRRGWSDSDECVLTRQGKRVAALLRSVEG